jgi:hypothetical protein
MLPALDLAAEAGLPAYLETTNPNNVELYTKLGWDIARTLRVDSLAVWVMNWMGKQETASF